MGERTFGKGSVQTILPMNNGAALKLTTARYFTPNGRSIQAEGIVPDIELEPVQVASAESDGFDRIKEADLSGHLDNPEQANGEGDAEGDELEITLEGKNLATTDYELYEALNLLKGLAILKNRI
jgi:carboxyl-terminal processing protease